MRRYGIGLVIVHVVAIGVVRAADPPPRVRATLQPQGGVWVGERVPFVVELLTPGYFASAPAFDLPRVPGVILFPPDERPIVSSETIDGTTYTTQRHELALFARVSGAVTVPPFRVRFESSPAFGKPTVAQQVQTPALSVTVKVPPGAAGLPAVLTTGGLTIAESLDSKPDTLKGPLRPGAALTRRITVTAQGLPGMVLPAFRFDDIDGVSVYERVPVVDDPTERGELKGRRVDIVTYVFQRAGTFTLPSLEIAWWDAQAKELRRSRLSARTFEVVAPPAAVTPAVPAPRHTGRWVAVATGSCVALAAAAWHFGPALVRRWREHRRAVVHSEAAYFRAFQRVCRVGTAAETLQALYAWMDRFAGDGAEVTLSRLAERTSDGRLATNLAALETAVFGRENGANDSRPPNDLARQVARARTSMRRATHRGRRSSDSLPPLNPGPTDKKSEENAE